MRFHVSLPAAWSALVAACSFTDLSGFAESPGAAQPDGSTTAPVDARGKDAGPPVPAPPFPPSPTCPAGAFCDAFDDGALGAAWGGFNINVGTLALDPGRFRSAPRSLHAVTPSGEGARPKNALLTHALPSVARSVRCAFSLLLHQQTGPERVDFFQLTGRADGVDLYLLKLGLKGLEAGTRVDVYKADKTCDCPRLSAVALKPLPVARWVPVVYTTDFKSVAMSFDGETVLQTDFQTQLARTTMNIELGLQDFGTDGADVSVDELVCTFTE